MLQKCIQLARFSTQIQKTGPIATNSLTALSGNRWLEADPTHKKSLQTHKSRAEEYIHRVPVIEVAADLVRCMGGTHINAGHPQVYIKLDTRTEGQIQTCKYCGLRYQKKHDHH